MVNAQQWLESQKEYNTKEKREQITELDISEKVLESSLDLTSFVNLTRLITKWEINFRFLNLNFLSFNHTLNNGGNILLNLFRLVYL